MRSRRAVPLRPLVLLVTWALLAACARQPLDGAPPVRRSGESVYRLTTADLELTLNVAPARLTVAEREWLVLEIGVSGTRRSASRLDREGVVLVLPDGEQHALAGQRELVENFTDLEAFLRRAAIAGPPLSYHVRDRRRCRVPFFAEAGKGTVADSLFVTNREYCLGHLFYRLQQSVQPGDYRLIVSTERDEGVLPFVLPSRTR